MGYPDKQRGFPRIEDQVEKFLQMFLPQDGAGLLVLTQPAQQERVLVSLELAGLSESFTSHEALSKIKSALPTFIFLDPRQEQGFSTLISRYNRLATGRASLLLVTLDQELPALEAIQALGDKVAIVRKI